MNKSGLSLKSNIFKHPIKLLTVLSGESRGVLMLFFAVIKPHPRFFLSHYSASLFSLFITRFNLTGLDPYYNFRPAYCKVICDIFIFIFLNFLFQHERIRFEAAFHPHETTHISIFPTRILL